MRELREDSFAGNKKDDAHEHVDRILYIASLFNILGVTHDAVMLHVFSITLTRAAKRWVDRLTPRTINTCDLLKKAFIQRYYMPSKTAKQLEDIRNFKQEGEETLYHAWESQSICGSNSSDGMAAIASKLDNLGPHLDKECPLNGEVKSMEEVKYGEFGRPFPNNNHVNEKFGGDYMGRPLLATTHAKIDIFRKSISLEGSYKEADTNQEKIEEYEIVEQCLNLVEKRAHWCKALSQEKEGLLDLEWEDLSFDNWVRIKFGKVCKMTRDGILEDYWRKVENEKKEDFKEYGESKTNAILKIILEIEDETWFSSTSDGKNDLGGIIDQLKLNLHDKSTDPDKENHQERKCKLLGIIYKEPPPTLIEKIEVTRYNIGLGEIYTGTKILGINKIPRTSTNVANVHAILMDELGADGSTKGAT
ncbi:RNA-directed DNA polymerase, eukaryota, reverse transcriptase zinc-binding domain protein [Tanacetum coccineum]